MPVSFLAILIHTPWDMVWLFSSHDSHSAAEANEITGSPSSTPTGFHSSCSGQGAAASWTLRALGEQGRHGSDRDHGWGPGKLPRDLARGLDFRSDERKGCCCQRSVLGRRA